MRVTTTQVLAALTRDAFDHAGAFAWFGLATDPVLVRLP